MAVELLVDESRYREALTRFNNELNKLRGYKNDLQTQINRMTGSTYSGSNVRSSIEKAKATMHAVEKAIERAQKQRDSIEFVLNQSLSTGAKLEQDINAIQIPNLFK